MKIVLDVHHYLKNYISVKFKGTISIREYVLHGSSLIIFSWGKHYIFQTLGDAKKREQYDRFGYTAAREQQKPSRGFHSPFGDGFFREFNFNFNGFNQEESYIQKFDINLR